MNARFFALALVLCAATSTCFAGEEPGRYAMTPAGDGFLRLDTATGAVSICRQKLDAWTCEGVADDTDGFPADSCQAAAVEYVANFMNADPAPEGAPAAGGARADASHAFAGALAPETITGSMAATMASAAVRVRRRTSLDLPLADLASSPIPDLRPPSPCAACGPV